MQFLGSLTFNIAGPTRAGEGNQFSFGIGAKGIQESAWISAVSRFLNGSHLDEVSYGRDAVTYVIDGVGLHWSPDHIIWWSVGRRNSSRHWGESGCTIKEYWWTCLVACCCRILDRIRLFGIHSKAVVSFTIKSGQDRPNSLSDGIPKQFMRNCIRNLVYYRSSWAFGETSVDQSDESTRDPKLFYSLIEMKQLKLFNWTNNTRSTSTSSTTTWCRRFRKYFRFLRRTSIF